MIEHTLLEVLWFLCHAFVTLLKKESAVQRILMTTCRAVCGGMNYVSEDLTHSNLVDVRVAGFLFGPNGGFGLQKGVVLERKSARTE